MAMFGWDARGMDARVAQARGMPTLSTLVNDLDDFVQHIATVHGGSPVEDIAVIATEHRRRAGGDLGARLRCRDAAAHDPGDACVQSEALCPAGAHRSSLAWQFLPVIFT